jgi:hypothetical protein
MHRVKRFDVLSVAKILGLCYGAIGLFLIPVFLFFGMIASTAAKQQGGMPAGFGAMFGVGMAVMAPIMYGVMGFIMGALGAFVYNLISGWIGGIEVELEPVTVVPVQLVQQPT